MIKKRWIVLILMLPIVLNFLFIFFNFLSYETELQKLFADNLTNSHWLSFWGAYLPAVVTLFSIYILWKNNENIIKNQNDQTSKLLDSQKKEIQYNQDKQEINDLKRILLETLLSFNTEIFFNFLSLKDNIDIVEQKNIFLKAQSEVVRCQTQIELLTDMLVSFENCNCETKICEKRLAIETLREQYFIEVKKYYELLSFFLTKIIFKEEEKEKYQQMYEGLLKEKIILEKVINEGARKKEIDKEMEEKIKKIEEIKNEIFGLLKPKVIEINKFREDDYIALKGVFKQYLLHKEKEIKYRFNSNVECKN